MSGILPSLLSMLTNGPANPGAAPNRPPVQQSIITSTSSTATAPTSTTDGADSSLHSDPDFDPELLSPSAIALSSSATHQREVSMVEKLDDVGVTFSPRLSEQRQEWAMGVLREEGVGSVLDVGCGEGALLHALCQPPATIPESPILSLPNSPLSSPSNQPSALSSSNGHKHHHHHHHRTRRQDSNSSRRKSSTEDYDDDVLDFDGDFDPRGGSPKGSPTAWGGKVKGMRKGDVRELFLYRIAGLDVDPVVIPKAAAVVAPPSPTDEHVASRWQRMDAEIWQGSLERHNPRLEGFEAIVAMEVIEHLDAPSLDVFPQMIFGTLRPRLVLITTPNFQFNAKFPTAHSHEEHVDQRTGWPDKSGRTDRVFRHSDHKFEWTEEEFRNWCAGAEEWGYSCEISGVGISSQPSYHDNDKTRPLYASQTAIFKLETKPTRSPRSMKTMTLPFMPGGGEALHPHRLAAKYTHEPRGAGEGLKNGQLIAKGETAIRSLIASTMARWNVPQVTIQELWGHDEISIACAGSKRTLVRALGGWGNVKGSKDPAAKKEFEVLYPDEPLASLSVRWKGFKPEEKQEKQPEVWGQQLGAPITGTDASKQPTEW